MSIIEQIREVNLHGWATFPTKNKIPLEGHNWKKQDPDPFFDESAYATGEYAVILRPTDLIIDLDPRNFPKDRNPWRELKATLGLQGFEDGTYIVKTGGGGLHIYLSKPADVRVRKTLKEYPGVDFLGGYPGKGLYVLGPLSNHESGQKYKILKGNIDKIKAAPEALLKAIERGAVTDEKPDREISYSDDEQTIARYKEYLENAPVAVQGQNGDLTTYKISCRGRDLGLSPDKTYTLLLECYNGRCNPPWSHEDLKAKVNNAYKYAEMAPGSLDPAKAFEAKPGADKKEKAYDEWDNQWLLKPDGSPKAVLKNAVMYLTIWPEIHKCLRFNELSQDVEITGELPWHGRRIGRIWCDSDTAHLKYFFSSKVKTEFPTTTLLEAVYIVASRNTYHPIRKYILGLKWDGVPRIDKWLTTYCGVQETEYTQAVGRKTLVAAVTRIMKPGCKADHVLVLEGAQNIGKSYAVAILGGDYFGDFNVDPGNKDTVDAMRGKWFIELPEMAAVRKRKDVEELKAFITRTEDRVRFAYARTTADLPRQCIFIGTVNPDGAGYLVDKTGNRRFWPVLCTGKVKIHELKHDRDQLFAEAFAEGYLKDEKLYLADDGLQQIAEDEANDRVEADPWIEIIYHWSDNAGKEVKEVSTTMLYEIVLGGVSKSITRWDQIRIGKALSMAGWYKKRVNSGFVYHREKQERFPEVALA
jgi:predicted P-loop ATPase